MNLGCPLTNSKTLFWSHPVIPSEVWHCAKTWTSVSRALSLIPHAIKLSKAAVCAWVTWLFLVNDPIIPILIAWLSNGATLTPDKNNINWY